MNKSYTSPKCELIMLTADDIITTSIEYAGVDTSTGWSKPFLPR